MRSDDEKSKELLRKITIPLLKWYDLSARVLPWRLEECDPYKTLVSEIMLQQTRVETVKPYFERFISELPDVNALARVPEDRLMKLWEGLGYYSRARNLQKAAQKVVEKFNGTIPSGHEELLSLPGIGEYTAGAIGSIAFGFPTPAVDGNVLRVCARLLDCHEDIADPSFRDSVASALKEAYPPDRCGDFTQSLMELGAMICLPGAAPKCGQCPLSPVCRAREEGTFAELPVKKQKSARKIEEKTLFLLISKENRIALDRRPGKGVLAGMWEFPAVPGILKENELRAVLKEWGIEAVSIRNAGKGKHIFTHLEWHMNAWLIRCGKESARFTWTTKKDLFEEHSIPSAFKTFTRFLLDEME